MIQPVFIVGVPRSGTTLMRSVLSAHRRITIAPETHFLDVFATSTAVPLNHASFDAFWLRFTRESQFAEFHLDPALIASTVHDSGDYRASNVFRIMLEEYARKQGKPRWGEKTPEHYRHVDQLFEWFTDARVIHMLRDPRAVCASLMSVPWRRRQAGPGVRALEPRSLRRSRHVYHDAVVWRDSIRDLDANWRNDGRVRVFRYEDLVQQPVETARAVCQFLGETYDPGMVAGRSWDVVPPPPRGSADELVDWRYHHVRRTLGDISTTSISKWRTQLSAWEISVIEHICGETMTSCEYTLEGASHAGSRVLRSMAVGALASAWAIRRQIVRLA